MQAAHSPSSHLPRLSEESPDLKFPLTQSQLPEAGIAISHGNFPTQLGGIQIIANPKERLLSSNTCSNQNLCRQDSAYSCIIILMCLHVT